MLRSATLDISLNSPPPPPLPCIGLDQGCKMSGFVWTLRAKGSRTVAVVAVVVVVEVAVVVDFTAKGLAHTWGFIAA